MNKFDDYKDLINDIAKEQNERREHTVRPSEAELMKSAEKLLKMGMPLSSVAEGLELTPEQLATLQQAVE